MRLVLSSCVHVKCCSERPKMTVLTPRCQCRVCAGAACNGLCAAVRGPEASESWYQTKSPLPAPGRNAACSRPAGLRSGGSRWSSPALGSWTSCSACSVWLETLARKQRIKRRFEFVAQKAQRTANMEVFRTWVRLEVLCCFGQEVKHRLAGHLDFLKKGCS